jgi:hypothetical protein
MKGGVVVGRKTPKKLRKESQKNRKRVDWEGYKKNKGNKKT